MKPEKRTDRRQDKPSHPYDGSFLVRLGTWFSGIMPPVAMDMGKQHATSPVPLQLARAKRGKVIIVDRFTGDGNLIDLSGDGLVRVSHGDILKTLIAAHVPENNILCIDIASRPLPEALDEVFHYMDNLGEDIVAVNFSQQTFETTIEGLSRVTGISGITCENIHQYKPLIRCRLQELDNRPGLLSPEEMLYNHWDTIVALDKITHRNIPVFVAAGNEGPDHINLYTLAFGIVAVGALDSNNQLAPYTSYNSIVSRLACGDFPITGVCSGDMVNGLSFTGGNQIDVPVEGNVQAPPPGFRLWGTSFATAHLAGATVREQMNDILQSPDGKHRASLSNP